MLKTRATTSCNLEANPDRNYAFWRAHGGIVWSNPHASDSVMIANALLSPDFHLLLDIAVTFGLARLKCEWENLKQSIEANNYPEEVKRLRDAAPIVARCIFHMEEATR